MRVCVNDEVGKMIKSGMAFDRKDMGDLGVGTTL